MLKAVHPGGDPYDWEVENLASKWYEGSTQRKELKSELANYGLDPESAISQALVTRCNELEKMERMLTSVEAKRNAMMRFFDDCRAMAPVMRNQIIDSEQAPLLPAS
jgi:hypothetical protein